MAHFIEAEKLMKKYKDFVAVRDVSFGVRQGEIFGLLGPNGAGKSTTMAMLTGLYKPTSGTIMIDGIDLWSNPTTLRKNIGYVPQELALYNTLSSVDNLMLFGQLYGLEGDKLNRRLEEVLDLVGLTDWAKVAVEKYSGGMKRRLNLALGIIHSPGILLLDEPTVGVDPQSRNHIFECIKALADGGVAVVYTTHYMEEVETLCETVAIIDAGKIIALDSLANLLDAVDSGVIEISISNLDKEILPAHFGRSIEYFEQAENILRLKTTSLTQALKEIGEFCASNALEIESVRTPEANLETVFLRLTGKRLRD